MNLLLLVLLVELTGDGGGQICRPSGHLYSPVLFLATLRVRKIAQGKP